MLPGGVSPIFWACFDMDSGDVATASADSTARVWTQAGELQQVLEGHEDNVIMAGGLAFGEILYVFNEIVFLMAFMWSGELLIQLHPLADGISGALSKDLD